VKGRRFFLVIKLEDSIQIQLMEVDVEIDGSTESKGHSTSYFLDR
jgi:hypothetical protein